MSRRSCFFLISVVVVLVFCYFGLRSLGKRMFPKPYIDPADYGAVLEKWKQTGLVKFFPASIPPDARGVRMSAFPGYLQGRPWIQLRMQFPSDEVASIEADARALTNHIYSPDHRFSLPAKNDEWPIPNYRAGDTPDQFLFPSTFKLYVVSAIDRGRGSWDPYESYGIAISKETNEVVYWADQ